MVRGLVKWLAIGDGSDTQ